MAKPISMSNVETVIGIEDPTTGLATTGKLVAWLQNTLNPNQTMEANKENRGNRQAGARVPGMKNPGGNLAFHMTDRTLPLAWYAILGKIVSTAQKQAAPTVALLPATAGLIDAGTHSYKYVITRPNGTADSTASASVTTDAGHGKVTVTRPGGTLPAGWTWAIYSTAAGNALVGPWILVPGASALAANVTSFVVNVADASLLGAFPSITNGDWKHVLTPGDTLPTLLVQKKFPYNGVAAAYFRSVGVAVNKATLKLIGAGFYDLSLDALNLDYTGPFPDSFDASPLDWRGGEKIHHAMLQAADMLLDDVAIGKFLDMTLMNSNNLITEDHPLGLGGALGSLTPDEAEVEVDATATVSDPDIVALPMDTSVLHKLGVKHSFATPGHYIKHEVFGISFDPTAPAPSGKGLLKLPLKGMASQPDGGDQIAVEIVNDIPDTAYQP